MTLSGSWWLCFQDTAGHCKGGHRAKPTFVNCDCALCNFYCLRWAVKEFAGCCQVMQHSVSFRRHFVVFIVFFQ